MEFPETAEGRKEKKTEKKRLLYLYPKLSPGLVPYRLFYRIGTAYRKMVMVYLTFHGNILLSKYN